MKRHEQTIFLLNNLLISMKCAIFLILFGTELTWSRQVEHSPPHSETHTFIRIQRHTMPLVKGNKYNYLILLILKCESAKQIGMVVNLGSRCVCHIMNTLARSACLPCTIEYIATICKGVVVFFFRLLVTEKMAVLCFVFFVLPC